MNSFTSSQKPRSTSGNDSRKTSHEKKVLFTSSQPGLETMSSASPPSTTTEETAATTDPRRACRRRAASRATRRSGAMSTGGGSPGLYYSSASTGASAPIHSSVIEVSSPESRRLSTAGGDARRQLRVLLQHHAPVVAAGRLELADQRRALDLGVAQVDRRREVGHDRVDLAVLERPHDVVRVVEDPRPACDGCDHLVDGLEARGADLHADLGVLEVGERGGVGELGVTGRRARPAGSCSTATRSPRRLGRSALIETWLRSKSNFFGPGA